LLEQLVQGHVVWEEQRQQEHLVFEQASFEVSKDLWLFAFGQIEEGRH